MAVIAYIVRMDRPSVLTVKKLIAMSPEMAQAIDDFRFANRAASESEAIRRLIEAGLRAEATPAPNAAARKKAGAAKP